MSWITDTLAQELGRPAQQVENVVRLLDEGCTIPFIARYRKELHGAMDDALLRTLEKRLSYLRGLQARRESILAAIEGQGKLTDALRRELQAAQTLVELEDLYAPFRQKRRTRASIARERGLEPLADALLAQRPDVQPTALAQGFVDAGRGVDTPEAALAGAGDILAERLSEDAALRRRLRAWLWERGVLRVQAAGEEDSVYKQYYDFSQRISRLQGYQTLAINRGEKEKLLRVTLEADAGTALELICRGLVRRRSPSEPLLRAAAEDAWSRLLLPSLEREVRAALTDTACEGAIGQFALNLRPLLMQPPVKGHVTMGLDPGYRMGCKAAVVDATGKVLDTAVVYPTWNERKREEAIETLSRLVVRHGVEHIAIGNGTASRETEQTAAELIRREAARGRTLRYEIVSEAGASVYSAGELAAEELPGMDVNLRSAVSIARRLQDPLAELVKIDPKAIGVGQYQHDMPPKRLDEALRGVVEDCVNRVGVDVNTASPALLQQVSGLTAATARSIVAYREENGPFTSRSQFRKVPRLGPKAFEQCAGFLRVPESENVLDGTAVHPESYAAADVLLRLTGHTMEDVRQGRLSGLEAQLRAYGEQRAADAAGVGLETLRDVAAELMKPGRDVRGEPAQSVLRADVTQLSDLRPGMRLRGTVRNVIDFGVFVDIGVHQDGLVHISQVADRFVRHPSEVVSVGQVVDVVVLEVDEKKKRISLSMKQAAAPQR